MGSVQGTLADAVKSLRLTYLHSNVLWEDNRIEFLLAGGTIGLHPMQQRLQLFDCEQFAHQVAEAVPTMEYVVTEFNKWPTSYWRVQRTPGSGVRSVTRMSRDEGVRMASSMEL